MYTLILRHVDALDLAITHTFLIIEVMISFDRFTIPSNATAMAFWSYWQPIMVYNYFIQRTRQERRLNKYKYFIQVRGKAKMINFLPQNGKA